MNLRPVTAALSHLRERNLRTLCRKLSDRVSERLGPAVAEVESSRAPAWLSTSEVTTYAVDETAYVGTIGSPDATFTLDLAGLADLGADGSDAPAAADADDTDADDADGAANVADADGADADDPTAADTDSPAVDAVEVPIVLPSASESVSVSTDAGSRTVEVDDSYDYPPQLWTTVPVPATQDAVDLRVTATERRGDRGLLARLPERDAPPRRTRVGLPAPRPTAEQPPIVLVSIDTLPYSERAHVQPLLDALGPDAVVPPEPRTQGHWTPPAHASMLTGTHPGTHGYVGHGLREGDQRPIRPDLETIPQLLADRGYKCSGLVSHTRVLPEFGFGRGFHRFAADPMAYEDWLTREHDARASVDRLREWIDADRRTREGSLCYFLHVFDPHFPYLPPLSRHEGDLDLAGPTRYREQIDAARGDPRDYLERYEGDHDVDPELTAEMERSFRASIEYTAEQVARLFDALERADLLADALVIVTGDHGEEFGERGYFMHSTLYDRVVRPFLAVKPPADAAWSVPDAVDAVDFLPTIARQVGASIPEQCAGEPLQDREGAAAPRITERIMPERYNVAVESGGLKGIFTYESGYPDRPSAEVIEDGPQLCEYYDLEAVRAGEVAGLAEPPQASTLERIATEFATSGSAASREATARATQPSQETEARLRDLGYR